MLGRKWSICWSVCTKPLPECMVHTLLFFHPFFLFYLLGLPICFLFEFCLCLVEMVILIQKTVTYRYMN